MKTFVPLKIILGLVLTFTAFSCSASLSYLAEEDYKKASYIPAMEKAIQVLNGEPADKSMRMILEKSYDSLLSYYEERIKALKLSADKNKWDDIVADYQYLIEINNSLNTKLTAKTGFATVDFIQHLYNARLNAAEAHYREGSRLLNETSFRSKQKAIYEFRKALEFVPRYKDSEEKYSLARKHGTMRVAVIPFVDKSGIQHNYGVSVEEIIFDKLTSRIVNNNRFKDSLEIISRGELKNVLDEQQLGLTGFVDEATALKIGEILGVQEIITGKLTQVSYSNPMATSGILHERKLINDVTEAATAIHYIKVADAIISGSYRIIDAQSAKIKSSETFSNKHNIQDEWAVYQNGNYEAFSDKTKVLLSGSRKVFPSAGEMLNLTIDGLIDNLEDKLEKYYEEQISYNR